MYHIYHVGPPHPPSPSPPHPVPKSHYPQTCVWTSINDILIQLKLSLKINTTKYKYKSTEHKLSVHIYSKTQSVKQMVKCEVSMLCVRIYYVLYERHKNAP